jgi:hypothetical protein
MIIDLVSIESFYFITEWTEEDESGRVQHVIEQTSSITVDESDPKCELLFISLSKTFIKS